MPKFQYKPLDKNRKEIRILRLHPASLSSADPVECTLLHVSLKSVRKPKYETVSYCWGDAFARAKITVNCRTLEIGSSAECVLRRMRTCNHTRTLWIDTVCINQKDDRERGHQVALMADIYSNTIQNLIWLGPEDKRTADALANIALVVEDARRESDDFREFEMFKHDKINYSHRGLAVDVNSDALLAFFDNAWFHRVWVMQEAVLAPDSLCHYGSFEIPLLSILQLAAWLLHKSLFLPFGLSRGMHNARAMWVYKYSRYSVTNMIQLLEHLRLCRARDPRDHVYGMLGIHGHRGFPTDRKIIPNYKKSLGDVLTEATNFAIEERLDLYICSMVSHRAYCSEDDREVPSWIPRWDRAVEPSEDSAELRYIFQANGSHAYQALDSDRELGSRTLRAKGIIVGTIETTWPVINNTILASEMLDVIHSVQDIWTDANVNAVHNNNHTVLAKTLVAGTTIDGRLTTREIVDNQYSVWLQGIQKHKNFPTQISLELEASEFDSKGAIYHQAFCNASFNRRLFCTKPGSLGLGPQNAQPDDLIAILWGCYWPIVLRPSDATGEYTMVGAAYIDGMMHGEAVSDAAFEEDEERAKTFQIR